MVPTIEFLYYLCFFLAFQLPLIIFLFLDSLSSGILASNRLDLVFFMMERSDFA